MATPRPLDGASLLFNEYNLKVFPLIPNGKTPAFEGWQEWARTATLKKIESFGTANPRHNWGVLCEGITVLDLDRKNGKDGVEALKDLSPNIPETLSVETPTGGIHLYYKGLGRNTQSLLADGIDTRGKGGYVVAPFSRIDNRLYGIKTKALIANLPKDISAKLEERKAPEPINGVIHKGKQHSTLFSLLGTLRSRGVDETALAAFAHAMNETQLEEPAPKENIDKMIDSIMGYGPKEAKAAADFIQIKIDKTMLKLAQDIEPLKIPRRQWIMKDRFVKGFVSALIAPGGVGKSLVSMTDAVSIAANKSITGFEVKESGAVWIYNTEDPVDELERRFNALALHHNVDLSQAHKVFYTSGRDHPLTLINSKLAENKELKESIIQNIKDNNILLFIVDPFVHSHEVNENDNMQISKVVKVFAEIADKGRCSVLLVHHTRKPNNNTEPDVNDARGASALINAARVAHMLQGMTKDEAKDCGIEEEYRGLYMRLDNGKANLQPPAKGASWFKKISVDIPNGDSVAAIEPIAIQSLKMKNEHEKLISATQDIGPYLESLIPVGKKISLSMLAEKLRKTGEAEHILGSKKTSYNSVRPFLIKMFQKGVFCGDKKYVYEYNPKSMPEHLVKCVKVKDNDIFS